MPLCQRFYHSNFRLNFVKMEIMETKVVILVVRWLAVGYLEDSVQRCNMMHVVWKSSLSSYVHWLPLFMPTRCFINHHMLVKGFQIWLSVTWVLPKLFSRLFSSFSLHISLSFHCLLTTWADFRRPRQQSTNRLVSLTFCSPKTVCPKQKTSLFKLC